jgi:hypothetical protein
MSVNLEIFTNEIDAQVGKRNWTVQGHSLWQGVYRTTPREIQRPTGILDAWGRIHLHVFTGSVGDEGISVV